MGARAHLPQQVAIDAYGNGGFRFGGMSHRGSILCLPTGIWDWPVTSVEQLDAASVGEAIALGDRIGHLLIGTGRALAPVPRDVRAACAAAGLWVESMDTGAAARTYNILLAEGRLVGAALIAVA